MDSKKDTVQRLYVALETKLKSDAQLRSLLGATGDDPRIYQMNVDFHTAAAIKGIHWVTFTAADNRPYDVEQTQDIRDIRIQFDVWARDVGSDKCEAIETRIEELLDYGDRDVVDLGSSSLLVWYFRFKSYYKGYEAQQNIWRIRSEFETMAMAVDEG